MRSLLQATLAACLITAVAAPAKPSVEFGGYLDADVWTDFAGSFYSNNELDLWMDLGFSDKLSASVCATILGGSIPAGVGEPSDRWVSVLFDGFSLSYESPVGTFTVGDLVYQYGGFSYYFYKRLSMITPESFTRGIQYSVGGEKVSQDILIGSADMNSVGDIVGATKLALGEEAAVGLYYGVRSDVLEGFESAGTFFAGAEYTGSLGEALALKLDLGYKNVPNGLDTAKTRGSVFSVLFEPVLTMGKFTTALSVYASLDLDSAGENALGIEYEENDSGVIEWSGRDDFFAYLEPGYAFNDVFAVGLPLEIHVEDMDSFSETGAFWAVPTFYIYPFDGVQWWLWGQMVAPLGGGDLGYGLGSEIIVEF